MSEVESTPVAEAAVTENTAPVVENSNETTQANFNKDPQVSSEAESFIEKVKKAKEAEEKPKVQAQEADIKKYEANLKFKVMDQEKEFDPFIREIIKDEETEKKVRELYEKAHGLDFVKPKYQETREKFKQLETNHSKVMNDIAELNEVYARGDFDAFFKKLAIPEQKILQWVVDKARYQELPAEQRQLIDSHKSAEQRAYELQKQNENLQGYYQQQVTQAKAYVLNTALEKPEMKAAIQEYDNMVGKPGAFREEVINRGEIAWYSRQEDISPEQAIEEALQITGLKHRLNNPQKATGQVAQATSNNYQQAPQMYQNQVPQQNVAAKQAVNKRPAAIPNVSGQSTSPVSKKYTSIDQLKKRYEEIRGS